MWSDQATEALLLSVRVSLVTTLVVVLTGIPLALWLVRRGGVVARIVMAACTLPLVVPPVATGYCLLLLLGPRGPLGGLLEAAGLRFALDWKGAVVASAVMAFPLFMTVARTAFQRCRRELEEAARTLNAGPLKVFATVTLPLAAPGLVAAAAMAFARAFGEFGATIMLAGNTPGQTRTVPLAIYGNLQAGKDQAAWVLVIVSVAVGIAATVLAQFLARQSDPDDRRRARDA